MRDYRTLLCLADTARKSGNPTEAAALAAEAHAMALDHRDEQEAMIPHSPIGQGDARRAVSLASLLPAVLVCFAAILMTGCGTPRVGVHMNSYGSPSQVWPDGLYAVPAGTAKDLTIVVRGPFVAIDGQEIATSVRKDNLMDRPGRWMQFGNREGRQFYLRSDMRFRFFLNGQWVDTVASLVDHD